MDQKMQFIADYLRQRQSMTALSASYGISRKTGSQLVERYVAQGPQGLEERSRKPSSSPNQTAEPLVEAFIAVRQRHPSWGARKLLAIVAKRHPRWELQPMSPDPFVTYVPGCSCSRDRGGHLAEAALRKANAFGHQSSFA